MDLDKFNTIKDQYNKAKTRFDPYQEAMNSQVWAFVFEAGTEAARYPEDFVEYVYRSRNENVDRIQKDRVYDFLGMDGLKNYLPGTITAEQYEISETEKTITFNVGDGYFFSYSASFKFEEMEKYQEEVKEFHHEWVVALHKEKKAKKKQKRKAKAQRNNKDEIFK